MPREPIISFGSFVKHTIVFVIGSFGLIWGVYILPQSEATDEFRDIEGRLLRFETFSSPSSIRILESRAALDLSSCDTHAQRAMLLMEMPLAQAALRSGATEAFDLHIESIEARSRRILSCAPRDSFVWLLMFDLAVLHGLLNDHSFDLLAMSYETSPNEAWISIRRITVALPLVMLAPQFVREEVTSEFQQLIINGFVDNAASAYLTVSPQIRLLLQTQIGQLDHQRQQAFLSALRKFHS